MAYRPKMKDIHNFNTNLRPYQTLFVESNTGDKFSYMNIFYCVPRT